METLFERFTLTADDGMKLAAVRWLPPGEPRAIVQISHGLAEYAERYARFAQALNAAGFGVYAHDHRGHGGSIDEATPRGHYADEHGWSKVLADLDLANRNARAAHPGRAVFLFGHSMGSFIARAYLLEHGDGLAGAVLSATGWRLGPGSRVLRWFAQRDVRRHGARAASRLMTKLVFGTFNLQFIPSRTAFDWLSADPSEVDAYIADPGCGFDSSGQLWDDFLGGVAALERNENDPTKPPRTPLLLIAGSRDPVSMGGVGSGQVAARYRAAGNTDVTDRRYPGGRHELLNDVDRSRVVEDILAWLDGHLPKDAASA